MSRVLIFLAAAVLLASCVTKKLSKRVRGTWRIDHYDEWTEQYSTGHNLDNPGRLTFYRSGNGILSLTPGKPHGAFEGQRDFSWTLKDSLVTLRYATGRREEWLITLGDDIIMEWVSVNAARDSVRTIYIRK